jgi:hypothetical protein
VLRAGFRVLGDHCGDASFLVGARFCLSPGYEPTPEYMLNALLAAGYSCTSMQCILLSTVALLLWTPYLTLLR